ncbi:hypothetical protein LH29_10665 [Draconibacterium sediminis]|uniref:Type I restriction modification DNA specificity domain-containing protein n=1 Tax=Draconibacterium sediminis TaxID=1544798 RepID=A0A0D8J9J6_9BACT|nr:hypothetical protein LH29_10665 [Draconibacterium sediminis]
MIEDYKLLKKVMMQKILNQELRFKDKHDNFYPEWEERRLGEFVTNQCMDKIVLQLSRTGKINIYESVTVMRNQTSLILLPNICRG